MDSIFPCVTFLVFLLRVLDNWALIHAQNLALKENLPLHVCFCLFVPKSELSTLRHYSFMLKGLEEVEKVFGHIFTLSPQCSTHQCPAASPQFYPFQTAMQRPGHPVPPTAWRCRKSPLWFCLRPQARGGGHGLLTPQRATAEPGGCQEAASDRRPPHTGARNLLLKRPSAPDQWLCFVSIYVDTCLYLASALCLLCQVDAHNIVPCWVASPKLEYAARTIRGKINKQLPEFLTEFPPVKKHPRAATRTAKVRVVRSVTQDCPLSKNKLWKGLLKISTSVMRSPGTFSSQRLSAAHK